MELRVAALTVIAIVPETPAKIVVIVTLPVAIAVNRPRLPAALLTIATEAEDDSHATCSVRSSVVPSEKVPSAVS